MFFKKYSLSSHFSPTNPGLHSQMPDDKHLPLFRHDDDPSLLQPVKPFKINLDK